MKRAQLTIFLILGILLLAGVFLALYSTDTFAALGLGSSPKYIVTSFVEDCLKKTGEFGLLKLGEQGGELDAETTLDEVQSSYERFIAVNINKCTNGFGQLQSQGISVTAQDPQANVIFTAKSTDIKLQYPLKITKENNIDEVEAFQVRLPVRFRVLYEAAVHQKVVFSQEKAVDMSAFGSTDFVTEIYPEEEGMKIIFKDALSKINTLDYWFVFSLK